MKRPRAERLRPTLPLAIACALDLLTGEPPAWAHPVVWVGRVIGELEQRSPRTPRHQLAYGGLSTCTIVIGMAAVGMLVERLPERWSLVRVLATAWLLKSTFAIRGLSTAAADVRRSLARSDVTGARQALRSLVSRDVSDLPAPLLAAAAIESVAENAGDAVVAPLLYYTLGGLAAACAYRAANTIDSMWGYHGEYEYLGKAPARLDDLLNLVPARLTAVALVGAAAISGKRAGHACQTLRRDRTKTASPNAGWPMSAMAGALDVELEKVGHYRLGAGGRLPGEESIAQAVHLLYLTTLFSVTLCAIRQVLRDVGDS